MKEKKLIKLGVDARMLHGHWQYRGIGRFIKSMIKQLPDTSVTAFLPAGKTIERYKTISSGSSFFAWFEQKTLSDLAMREKPDYLLCPSITSPVKKIAGVKKIVVIYDLIFMQPVSELPLSHSIYNNFGRLYRKWVAPLGYKTADYLISISEYSKEEAHTLFGIDKKRIFVIPCSIPDDWFVEKPLAYGSRDRYFLTVSGDAPSKNLYKIIEAFSKIVREKQFDDFNLRIVGVTEKSKTHYQQFAKKAGVANHVVFESFQSNEQLKKLYQKAYASLTLSLYEGFGIPIVEAMASGTPVICSNTTSMPEVAGNSALFADPRNVDDMAEKMLFFLEEEEAYRELKALQGLEWSKRFSDNSVAEIIRKFWVSLV
jgi:glycosyltransferase involved in cell wall biosynthesis